MTKPLPSHVAQLSLKNYKCFRGQHVLDLEPKPYSLVASVGGSSEQSNAAGKTSLLLAFGLALFGVHDAQTEDEWITRGEKSGEVAVVLDEGTRIVRSRIVGSSTKLYVFEGDRQLMGDEAQARVEELLGLTAKDWAMTSAIAQKQMAALLMMRKGELQKVIARWLRLEPFESAEKHARERAATASSAEQKASAMHDAAVAERQRAFSPHADPSGLRQVLDDAEARLATARAQGEQATIARRRAMELEGLARDHAHLLALQKAASEIEEGTTFDVEAERATIAEADACIARFDQALGMCRADKELRAMAARGQFDGTCPVAGIACPAKAEINANQDEAARAVAKAEDKAARIRHDRATVLDTRERAMAVVDHAERLRVRLAQMRDEAKALLPRAKEYVRRRDEQGPAVEQGLDLEVASGDAALARQRLAAYEAADARAEAARALLIGSRCHLASCREAVAVLARVRRQAMEQALAEIVGQANAAIAEAGVRLEVSARWEREADGLAAECSECATPFPTSRKERACATCGAERGPKVVQELEVSCKPTSGAMVDVAGGLLQLAAAAWLRGERASRWGLALIDEPFTALDASNRRSLARYLNARLGERFGLRQSIVVSHTRDVVDVFAGKLLVESDGEDATVKVVA